MRTLPLIIALFVFAIQAVSAQSAGAFGPDTVQLARSMGRAGQLLKSDPAAALREGRRALIMAMQLTDLRRQRQCLSFLATAADYAGEPEAALHYDQQALALAQQQADSVAAAQACHGLAATLADRHDTTSAGRYLRLGLRLVPAGPKGYGVRASLLNSVATLDYNAGRFGRALAGAQAARQLLSQTSRPSYTMLSSTEGLLAACYSDLGDERRARALLGQVLARDRRTGHLPQVVENLTTLSHSLLKDRPQAGLDTLKAALSLSRRLGLRERTLDCYEEYRKYYARAGRYRDAYEWVTRYHQLDDSINERQQQDNLRALDSKYEARAREQQILTLNQRSRISTLERTQQQARNRQLLGLVALLVVGLGGAATFVWKLKRRDQLLARQNAALVAATTAAHAHAAARDRLYAIVAHDLRGPVASFGGVSQLIELYLQQQDGAGLRQVTTLVRQTARNLSELLNNLLGWTLSQTGELTYTPEQLLLAPLLADIKHLYGASAKIRRIGLELLMPLADLHVWADAQMVQTILRNLVGNALKFTPEGGHLRVSAIQSAGTDEPGVILEIADTGSGMSAAQIKALLDAAPGDAPLPPSHDPRAGTGLGLSLCLAFVRRQGGELTIESQPGVGTTVRVRLPVRALPAEKAAVKDIELAEI